MKSMIITPQPSDPEVKILTDELKKRGYEVDYFIPGNAVVKVNIEKFKNQFEDLEPRRALIRGLGTDATQKVFFRLDLLRAIEEYDVRLINSREALELASDKFLTTLLLEKNDILTPKTVICENAKDALASFEELGGDVVLKPLFGSKGIGVTRLNDKAFAEYAINTLNQLNIIFYLQEFIEHNNRDIRVLVIGNEAIAGMYRVSDNWKTNVHAGAYVEPLELTTDLVDLAIKAAQCAKTEIAGVDLMECDNGLYVIEVNSIPGFTGLQQVTDINLAEKIIDYFLESI